jgi:chemotaxis response regulator CheB
MARGGKEEATVAPIRVLVVDDDESIRDLFAIALSVEDGIGEVRVAENGSDAIQVCRDFEPDVIVLDSTMPVMDGPQAAGIIRRMRPEARIVAFSSQVDEKPYWADHYWPKGDLPDMAELKGLGAA